MIKRSQFTRWVRKFHRWVGVGVAVQLILWIAGGLVMASLDLQQVRGAHYAVEAAAVPLQAERIAVSPAQLLEQVDAEVSELRIMEWQGQAVYRLRLAASPSRPLLMSAETGRVLSPLDETMARQVARADYSGPGQLISAQWLDEVPREARGRRAPLWRVHFNDAIETAIYVSADSGQVVARRNNWWRLFDVVWMLHIMDYDTRDDFNHPLLVIAAASALLFALSGAVLLVLGWWPRSTQRVPGVS